jgi:hypothetical protein
MSFQGTQQLGAQNPLIGGSQQLQGLVQLLAPMLQPYVTQATGMVPGQYAPMQNTHDQMRQREDAVQMQQALQAGVPADTSRVYALARGVHLQSGLGWGTEQQEMSQTIAEGYQSFMPQAAPFVDHFMPGFMEAAGGAQGSNLKYQMEAMKIAKQRLDPVTGQMGVSGTHMGEMGVDIATQLYGPGAKAGSTRGYTMGQLGEMMVAGHNRGMGPASIRTAISDADVSRLRAGKGLSDAGRENLSDSEAKTLETTTPGKLDQTLQSLESGRVAEWSKKMSGAMSAMRDLFGPNMPMEQMFESMNAMTQGGFSKYTPEQMEMEVRQMRQLSKASGMGMDQMIALQVTAADAAQRAGGSRDAGVDAAQHAAAFQAAFKSTGIGSADMQAAGVSMEQLVKQDAILTAQAQASPAYKQMAATLAIGERMGFGKDTEAAAMYEALKNGETEYKTTDANGKIVMKSVHQDERDWANMVSQGSGMDMDQAVAIRMGNNEGVGRRHNLQTTVRSMQFAEDLAPIISDAFAGQLMGGGVGRQQSQAVGDDIAEIIRNFQPDAGASEQDTEMKLQNQISAHIVQATGMAPTAAKAAAMTAMTNANTATQAEGYGRKGVLNAALVNRPKLIAETARNDMRAGYDAQISSAMSSLGQLQMGARVAEFLQTTDGTMEIEEFIGTLLGGIERDDVREALKPFEADLKTKLGEAEDIKLRADKTTGRLSAADEKALKTKTDEIEVLTEKMAEERKATIETAVEKAAKLDAAGKLDPTADKAAVTKDKDDPGNLTGKGGDQVAVRFTGGKFKVDISDSTGEFDGDAVPDTGGEGGLT